MLMKNVTWIYGDDHYAMRMKEVADSIKSRKDISRDDYLDLLRSRLAQWKVARCVARIAHRGFFHEFWGLATMYPMTSSDDPIVMMASGGDSFGQSLEEWLVDAIDVIEKGAGTRQDMIREDRKGIEGIETTIDQTLLYFECMRELCEAACNVKTLSDFEDLYACVYDGHFGPRYTKDRDFGIAWYGPRDKYEQFRQRHGFRNAAGDLETPFPFVEERLDTAQKMALKDLLRKARKEASDLKDAGKPLPEPWI